MQPLCINAARHTLYIMTDRLGVIRRAQEVARLNRRLRSPLPVAAAAGSGGQPSPEEMRLEQENKNLRQQISELQLQIRMHDLTNQPTQAAQATAACCRVLEAVRLELAAKSEEATEAAELAARYRSQLEQAREALTARSVQASHTAAEEDREKLETAEAALAVMIEDIVDLRWQVVNLAYVLCARSLVGELGAQHALQVKWVLSYLHE